MSDLEPCPCGKTPEKLFITDGHLARYSWASPDCCGEWAIEFDNHYQTMSTDANDVMDLAVAAWNEASRA